MACLILYAAGFSYSETGLGSINPVTGDFENATFDGVKGRYPVIDPTIIGRSTSEMGGGTPYPECES